MKWIKSFSIAMLVVCALLLLGLAGTGVTITRVPLAQASSCVTSYRVNIGRFSIAAPALGSIDWRIRGLRSGWLLLPRLKTFP